MRSATEENQCCDFVKSVTDAELKVIGDLAVRDRLVQHLKSGEALRKFATGFYFVRVHFVKINFIVGSRCPSHELYWQGLAHNLMEELGGEAGPTHNELYRWFLKEADIENEDSLRCPGFAEDFDGAWENYSREAPLEEALGAIAVYEIFDNPDYQMLLNVMSRAGVSARGRVFFKVHAKAAHFELFEDYFRHVSQKHGGMDSLQRATNFVVKTQKNMWSGLLKYVAGSP